MDLILQLLDNYVFDYMYAPFLSFFPTLQQRDYIWRQYVSTYLVWCIGGILFYLVFSSLNYVFLYDKSLKKNKLYLQNQIPQEILTALNSIPIMAFPSAAIFLAEVRGYSMLYEGVEGMSGWIYISVSIIIYLFFTDMCIYWIHRWLHIPILYTYIHKPHHKWIISTPFASHAFHPIDGFLQSIPYHIFVFLFPLNKFIYIALFIFVNMWTISIHDNVYFYNGSILNGAEHHTIHHRQFNYNFGQYFTLWDKICGTHKLEDPSYKSKQA